MADTQIPVIFVTGMSGAGMTTALDALQDAGYERFDNFPVFIVDALLGKMTDAKGIAIGVDSRTRDFSYETLSALFNKYKDNPDYRIIPIFLDCADDELNKRFQKNQRAHPASMGRNAAHGITQERQLLNQFSDICERTIDTTDISVHDLKRLFKDDYALDSINQFIVTVMSFGFKHGMPRSADDVEQLRWLNNPYWDEKLRSGRGTDKEIQEYISADPEFNAYLENIKRLLDIKLPRIRENSHYYNIAFGCTGGHHRSVFIAELIGAYLKEQGYRVSIEHRDFNK